MCGIVGLFFKRPWADQPLGHLLAGMLAELGDRGPDSTGFAVYGAGAPAGAAKATLYCADPAIDWSALETALAAAFPLAGPARIMGSHAVFVLRADADALSVWLATQRPDVRLFGFGTRIEVFKDVGLPASVADRFGLHGMGGSHALGHTRMATESAVTTEHSHPFSSGVDLCLVHNGSEVAARYLAQRLGAGDSLRDALEAGLSDLDGFYTFAVGTHDGFAILRDPIACKPAVLGETDDWVAMASEYRAIATLPGAEHATIWEPEPATVYAWQRL
jgi:glutamate synthase domain-containing protein 1